MNSTKPSLYFVGAGNLAREIFCWMGLGSPERSEFEFRGFIEDGFQSLRNYPMYPYGVVATFGDFSPRAGDRLVMAISDPAFKLRTAAQLQAKGGRFLTYVHPSALISDHVTIGEGVVICPNVVVSCHAKIGDFANLNLACTIGHDATIGRGSTLSAHVDITGHAVLGEGVFVGSHGCVLPHAKVGNHAKIGAGSVVLRGAAADSTVMGVPAKQILP